MQQQGVVIQVLREIEISRLRFARAGSRRLVLGDSPKQMQQTAVRVYGSRVSVYAHHIRMGSSAMSRYRKQISPDEKMTGGKERGYRIWRYSFSYGWRPPPPCTPRRGAGHSLALSHTHTCSVSSLPSCRSICLHSSIEIVVISQ